MKNSRQCPKCHSGKISRISGNTMNTQTANKIGVGFMHFGAVPVTRYLCVNCGYSEEWVDHAEDLEKVARQYPPRAEDDFV